MVLPAVITWRSRTHGESPAAEAQGADSAAEVPECVAAPGCRNDGSRDEHGGATNDDDRRTDRFHGLRLDLLWRVSRWLRIDTQRLKCLGPALCTYITTQSKSSCDPGLR